MAEDRTGQTWRVTDLPCPWCAQMTVIGYLLVNERGEHMHTRYVCTFWRSGLTVNLRQIHERCGWEGWSVPGWDREDDDPVEWFGFPEAFTAALSDAS